MNLSPSLNDVGMWAPLAAQLLVATPFLVICGIAIALAIVRWQQHPRVSLFVVIACSVDIVASLAGAGLAVLPLWHLQRGGTNVQLGMVMATANGILGAVRLVAFGLLVAAVFTGRRTAAQQG